MDVLEMRVPEYYDTASAGSAPISCAADKAGYIKDRKDVIEKMNAEIKALEKTIKESSDTENYIYQNAVKRLKKCCEIKKNCEASIVLTERQLEVERNSHIKLR